MSNRKCIGSLRSAFVLDNVRPNDVARSLIEEGGQKEPFYVLTMDEAYHRVSYFKEHMPRVNIFYAMKSNDAEMVLKLMVAMGVGFDCASPGEIYKILQLGVNPLSIIFAVPAKPPQWMGYARAAGVQHTTYDSSDELKKLQQHWPDAKLLLRIKVEGISLYNLGDKFGCDFETEAVGLLEEAALLGLTVVGVAFHVGSGCSSADSHVIGLRRAKALFEHEKRAGRRMYIVDIGGGYLSDRTDRINEVAALVTNTVEELFPEPDVQIIAEPGRYISEPTSTLYCSISNVRKIMKDGEKVNMIYLNDGFFGTLRYNESWHTVAKYGYQKNIKKNELEKTILWGPSCDSTDRVMGNVGVMLPRCTSSDWLVFTSQGAYASVFATTFSCLPVPEIRTAISKDLWNKIKSEKVFSCEDFTEKPNISTPLPALLPPLPLKREIYINSQGVLQI